MEEINKLLKKRPVLVRLYDGLEIFLTEETQLGYKAKANPCQKGSTEFIIKHTEIKEIVRVTD